MSNLQNTTSSSIIFLLTGVPGLEAFHIWISIPFCFLYITALSGNSLILFAIVTQPSLHEPMYYFLSMLSTTDLGLSISTLVTMLGIFWFNARKISFNACLSQMFFIKLFTVMESSVLLAMAFDRFVAISHPLKYATILTDSRIAQIGVAIVIRGTLMLTPMVALLKRLSYCRSLVLHHSYCFHPDVMKLSCTDTKINNVVGLTAMISTVGVDSILILLSYVLIIKTVLSIASPEERKKAFSTCISHIGAVAIFYIPLISLSFVHRFGKQAPPYVHTMIANTYLLIPPVMNPIIYSVKTKQIRCQCDLTLSGAPFSVPAMSSCNFTHTTFVLIGFPGLEEIHFWMGFPLLSMYAVAVFGNCIVVFIVKTERSLHAPMYLFLCMLAAIDLALSTSTMPKILALFWFDSREITFDACIAQMFFIHALSAIESTILLAMAFDRYIAICHPLRHAAVLNNTVTAQICVVAVDVMKLAQTDTLPNVVYGLTAILLIMGVDVLFISLSYFLIIRTVLQLPSKSERAKAFGNCVSHISVVLAFYVPLIGLSVVHRFGNSLHPIVRVLMGDVYLLLPPVINPIIYAAKTKQIRTRVLAMFKISCDKDSQAV
ncbi:hypothetical protein QTO34_003848 [Cnephaeus nilssonii]|uniref:G-protein coupled receptors family 1 profile domain-containing protein n=1 Tax=Cnephaeus nilssonii TaxID=3371016 RepID=A0AA40HRD1_CNENI|nr:hypothetical protein QTO34_003848 [Eptesicus nilssonii]